MKGVKSCNTTFLADRNSVMQYYRKCVFSEDCFVNCYIARHDSVILHSEVAFRYA